MTRTFEEIKAELAQQPTRVIVELAATEPGGPWDAPFAPINPLVNQAAKQLVAEAGLQELVTAAKRA